MTPKTTCYAIATRLPAEPGIQNPLNVWATLHNDPPEKMRELALAFVVTTLRRDCQVYELATCPHCDGPQESRMRQVCEGRYQPPVRADAH
jgi:hypothetical protein